MPSKKSKKPAPKAKASSPSSPARVFSEAELPDVADALVRALPEGRPWRILFEGTLGAGKTTLVTHLLRRLGVEKNAEGSPSFPIAHEYRTGSGRRILHVDFYRLKSEAELEQTGILEVLWDPETIVLCEWSSLLPSVEEAMERDFPVLKVLLELTDEPITRRLQVSLPETPERET